MRVALPIAAVLLSACGGDAPRRFRPLAAGDAAPAYAAAAFTAGRTASDSLRVADLRGSTVLLNVWATWCHPCRKEMPLLDSLQREFGARGLRVVAVSIDDAGADAEVARFVEEHGISFTIARDPANEVARVFQTRGVPESFLIDRDGRITKHWMGAVDGIAGSVRGTIAETVGHD
jgi:peroxiredoxin